MSRIQSLMAPALAEQDQFIAGLADLFEDDTVVPQVIHCIGQESIERLRYLTVEELRVVLRLAHVGLMDVLKRMADTRELAE